MGIESEEDTENLQSLALTPSWSVAVVLTVFVAVSLIMERSIHRLSHWLRNTKQKPLFDTLEKMKAELMLLGILSLLLQATPGLISNICISSKFFNGSFSPCSRQEVEETMEETNATQNLKLFTFSVIHHSFRRILSDLNMTTCKEDYEPFVSNEGLEQLHQFIFVMAITHLSYSCLTMLVAILKVHTWRQWEEEVHMDRRDDMSEITRELIFSRQLSVVNAHAKYTWSRNRFLLWVACFFRQFGQSVVHTDYITLRMAFIKNHNLPLHYDFHSYMVRSMEEEFKMIVGVSAPLWGLVVAFMFFNINGFNLYFWIAIIPIILVLLVGTKLQHIIATLASENDAVSGFLGGARLKPRDDLFWFKKPELMLLLIHFILFQNAFELASFFWFWWEFGYNSCFFKSHLLVYIRLFLGFAGQLLCSYSTLPLYALVTQMGTNYKAALIPDRIREAIQGWGKEVKKKSKMRGLVSDDSSVRTESSLRELNILEEPPESRCIEIEVQPNLNAGLSHNRSDSSTRVRAPFRRSSTTMSSKDVIDPKKSGHLRLANDRIKHMKSHSFF